MKLNLWVGAQTTAALLVTAPKGTSALTLCGDAFVSKGERILLNLFLQTRRFF